MYMSKGVLCVCERMGDKTKCVKINPMETTPVFFYFYIIHTRVCVCVLFNVRYIVSVVHI